MENSSPPLTRTQIWLLAARPKTLWASIAPVIVGGALAWRDQVFHWPSVCAALVGAVLIQIGTNLANDLFDHLRGTDTPDRTGPLRVTQAGLATPAQTRNAMVLVFALAFLVGIYLVFRGGWPIVWVGLASIAAAILYTGGPYPFGYYGLGDLFVFIFFGPVAVAGTYYVSALRVIPVVWMASVPMGALATAILVVNNLRDINTDRRAGKKTLAVRLGRYGSMGEYVLMMLIAALTPLAMIGAQMAGLGLLLPTLLIAVMLPLILVRIRSAQGAYLNPLLAMTAGLQALYALVFAIGVNL